MKVIFLDIDGVMKPARCYLDEKKKKNHDGGFCELSVAAVNRLAAHCNAGVVFNTTWNARFKTMEEIKAFGKSMGLTCEILGKTKYPSMEKRIDAIHHWISMHPAEEVEKWVALDDCEIPSKNAVLINAEMGIGVQNYIDATNILGNRDPFVILM